MTGATAETGTSSERGILYSWVGVHSVVLLIFSSSEQTRVGLGAHSTSLLSTCSPHHQDARRPSVSGEARTW